MSVVDVLPLGRPLIEAGRQQPGPGRLIMVAPDQIPDGARVLAVVALVPGPSPAGERPRRPMSAPAGVRLDRRATGRPAAGRIRRPAPDSASGFASESASGFAPLSAPGFAPLSAPGFAPLSAPGSAPEPSPGPAPAPKPEPVAEPVPERGIGPGLLLDLAGRRVLAAGHCVDLTRREFDLLAHLATRPGRVLTRAQLLAAVWSPVDAADAGPRTVDVHVARLRRKLGPHGTPLSTLRGVGYRWSREERLPASSISAESP